MMPLTSQGRRPLRSRWIKAVLAIVGIALFFAFISLGTWQVQRRAWKLDLIERVNQRAHHAPVAVPPVAQWPDVKADTHEYLAVQAHGQWQEGRSVLTQAVTDLGAGFWLLTPLQQSDGTQVLVNRGFIPAEQRQAFVQQITAASPEATGRVVSVRGLLRMSEPKGGFMRDNAPQEDRWHSRDVQAIAAVKQLPHAAPFFIDQGLPSEKTTPKTWPRAGLTVIQFKNTHAVYALTWYGLALMVLGAAWLVIRHERRATSS